MIKAQEAAAAAEADKHRQEATAVAAADAVAKTSAEEKAATTAAKAKEKQAKEAQKAKATGGSTRGIPTIAQYAHNTALSQDLDDWELSEGDLPEGSNLSGNMALVMEYSEDEANS